ncbi:MAG TPA: M23 family metallopeptidase [Anaerolineales bacterium]|nr:M23 family metallopeptidase [Anaerolineales bacterium]
MTTAVLTATSGAGWPAVKVTTTMTTTPTPTETPVPAAMCSPLSGYSFADLAQIVSRSFVAPRAGVDDGHHGADFAHYAFGSRTTIAGVPISAAFDGVVAAAVAGSWPYGHFVIIETRWEALPGWFTEVYPVGEGESVYHLYAHLADPPGVAAGDALGCGEVFGLVGNSGWSGNYHLHFEIRIGPAGAVFESMSYYLTTTTEAERENYERWRFGGEFVPFDPMPVIEIAQGESG